LVVDEQDGPSAVLNETVTMVSFSTVPGASRQLQTKAVSDATENVEGVVSEADAQGGGWAVSRTHYVGSNDAAFR